MLISSQYGLGKYRTVEFRTDGQLVRGLNETALNKKFVRCLETVSALNFAIASGYRVQHMVSERYYTTYLLEKVR